MTSATPYYKNDFIDVDAGGTVTNFNMSNYLKFVAKQARLKVVPSFDQVYSNFTEYAWSNNNGGDPSMPSKAMWASRIQATPGPLTPQQAYLLNQYKMINVLPYVGKTDGITPNWRIRVGARHRDTSFTVAYNISRALKSDAKVKDVDSALHWDQGHAGNYDVLSAFTWIDQKLAAAK